MEEQVNLQGEVEVGEFTPILYGKQTGRDVQPTYWSREGSFYRIGNIVHVKVAMRGRFEQSSLPYGELRLGNLPFHINTGGKLFTTSDVTFLGLPKERISGLLVDKYNELEFMYVNEYDNLNTLYATSELSGKSFQLKLNVTYEVEAAREEVIITHEGHFNPDGVLFVVRSSKPVASDLYVHVNAHYMFEGNVHEVMDVALIREGESEGHGFARASFPLEMPMGTIISLPNHWYDDKYIYIIGTR